MIILPFLISIFNNFDMGYVIEAIPFSWHVLFYSAVFFTLGNIIYQVFAPSIIKENNSFADFKFAVKNFSHISKYISELNLPVDEYINKYKEYKKQNGIQYDFQFPIDEFMQTIESNKKERYKFLFDYYYAQRTTHYPHHESSETAELRFEKSRKYKEDLENDLDYNLPIAFWKLYELAKYYRYIAILFTFIFFLLGTLLTSVVIINSVYIVFMSDTFSFFEYIKVNI